MENDTILIHKKQIKMAIKKNQKIWRVDINNPKNPKRYPEKGIEIKEHKVIGISRYKICLDDDWFTTLAHTIEGKKKESYNLYLDHTVVTVRVNNHILGDGVFINLFSTTKPTRKTIQSMVAKANAKIDKEYGFLFSGAKEELWSMVENYNFED